MNISIYDATGLKIVDNKPMEKLDTGLFGYKTDQLTFGFYYSIRTHTISPICGEGIMHSTAYIGKTSSWYGGSGNPHVGSGSDLAMEGTRSIFGLNQGCGQTDIWKRLDCELKDSTIEKSLKSMFGDWDKTEPVEGILISRFYARAINLYSGIGWIFFNMFYMFLVLWTILMLLLGLLNGFIIFMITYAPIVLVFLLELLDPMTREAAFTGLLTFFFDVTTGVGVFFLPVIIVAELFIIYRALNISSVEAQMRYFVHEHLKLFMYLANVTKMFVNLIVQITQVIFNMLQGVKPW